MLKRTTLKITAVVLLLAICAFGIYYYKGYFDVTFIDRADILGDGLSLVTSPPETTRAPVPEPAPRETETADNLSNINSPGNVPTDVPNTPNDTSATGLPADSPPPDEDTRTFRSAAQYEKSGYVLTDTVYNKSTHVLGKITPPADLPDTFSYADRRVAVPVKVLAAGGVEYTVNYDNILKPRPAVEPYMGNLMFDRMGEISLLNSDGEPLTSMGAPDYYPAYTRDAQDRPVYYANVIKVGEDGMPSPRKTYYVLSDDGKSFVESGYNDSVDNRGVYADYPAYYGKDLPSEGKREYNLQTGTWSYTTIRRAFPKAYAFSEEGLALVADSRGETTVIDRSGAVSFGSFFSVRNESNNLVWEIQFCALPASFGEESVGHFYFDHGLIRMREQRVEYNSYRRGTKVFAYDLEKIYKTDGTEFAVPFGFEIMSYSNGVIRLQKDGKFGYMDYTGAWIAQPIYADATVFWEGLAVLKLANGNCGMIDTAGNIVLPFKYKYISGASSGVIAAYSDADGWVLLHKMARI